MYASFEIQSSEGSYSVRIARGSFAEAIEARTGRIFVFDEYFSGRVEGIALASSETAKSLDAMPALIEELRRRGANRQTELVAIGGGIVQDIAAFAASVYMRGIRWKYIPTTVLSMVDSCIGGKSSINVGPYKNLIGTFHPPVEIAIDPLVAESLTAEQKAAGLVEAAKICYCRGDEAFEGYLALGDDGPLDPVVAASLAAKKWFIETDEFDQAERLLLNFGHTFGHAIEGAGHFRITHGIAVAVGILCALEFRNEMGQPANGRVAALETHMRGLLGASPGLRSELDSLRLQDVVERFEADKKHQATHYTLILPGRDGEIGLERFEKSAEMRAKIGAAMTRALESIR